MRLFKFDSVPTDKIRATDFVPGDKSFVGRDLPTWDSALNALKQPWEYGLEVVERFANELQEVEVGLKHRQRRIKFREDDGDELDLDRLRAGQTYWRSCEREDTEGPGPITVVIDVGALGSVSSKNMLWRGGAAIALVRVLEERGHQVEVLAVTSGRNRFVEDTERTVTVTTIKRVEDALDISCLVNVVSGWFYRTVGFATFVMLAREIGTRHSEYCGASSPMVKSELDQVAKDAVYISGVYSFESAMALVKNVVHASN